jgi:hypothetical protein
MNEFEENGCSNNKSILCLSMINKTNNILPTISKNEHDKSGSISSENNVDINQNSQSFV